MVANKVGSGTDLLSSMLSFHIFSDEKYWHNISNYYLLVSRAHSDPPRWKRLQAEERMAGRLGTLGTENTRLAELNRKYEETFIRV